MGKLRRNGDEAGSLTSHGRVSRRVGLEELDRIECFSHIFRYAETVLERVDIQDSHGLATLIQAPFGRRLG